MRRSLALLLLTAALAATASTDVRQQCASVQALMGEEEGQLGPCNVTTAVVFMSGNSHGQRRRARHLLRSLSDLEGDVGLTLVYDETPHHPVHSRPGLHVVTDTSGHVRSCLQPGDDELVIIDRCGRIAARLEYQDLNDPAVVARITAVHRGSPCGDCLPAQGGNSPTGFNRLGQFVYSIFSNFLGTSKEDSSSSSGS